MVLGLNGHMFFGFQSLVQAIGEAATFHHPSGKFVDDDNLASFARAAHDIVAVFLKQDMGFQRIGDVMHQRGIVQIINRAVFFEQTCLAQQRFHMLIAGFAQVHLAGFFVQLIIFWS